MIGPLAGGDGTVDAGADGATDGVIDGGPDSTGRWLEVTGVAVGTDDGSDDACETAWDGVVDVRAIVRSGGGAMTPAVRATVARMRLRTPIATTRRAR